MQVTQSDRGGAVLDALGTAFPEAVRLQCWVHLRRKFTEGSWRKYTNNADKLREYGKYAELIHMSHTPEMAQELADQVLTWMRRDGEGRLADHFEREYLTAPYFTWALGKVPQDGWMGLGGSGDNLGSLGFIWDCSGVSGESGVGPR